MNFLPSFICYFLMSASDYLSPFLLSRNVKSWWLWLRYSCLCSSPAYSSSCVRRCLLGSTPMPRSTRASLWTLCPGQVCSFVDYSWPMCLETPAWCRKWQRMCEAACFSPQVGSNLVHQCWLLLVQFYVQIWWSGDQTLKDIWLTNS